ncbi:hypothetical protein Tco_0336898 [Tanacetum coccineum]
MGHFARECRAPRSKDNRNWNQGSSSKAVRIEDASEKAMCAIDGAGFDWSDMAEDEIQANMALMAFTDSESNSQLNDKGFVDSGCSRHMSGNIAHLSDFKDFDGGYVTFGGGANGGRITGKGSHLRNQIVLWAIGGLVMSIFKNINNPVKEDLVKEICL